MEIRRLNPSFGYIDPAAMDAVGASQVVIVGDTVHWSGIVDARSDATGARLAPGATVAEQLASILDLLDACLAAVGTNRTRIVTMTMFCTEFDQLSPALHGVFAPWIGDHRPTLTCIGVSRLASPAMLLEVQGTALLVD
jgi:2-iminobutanoate/2-iminopropanoate deaminase